MKSIILILSIFFLISCQEGLEPLDESSSGSFLQVEVEYKGGKDAWPKNYENPEQDSIYDLRVIAFKDFPPEDLVNEILNGNAIFTDQMDTYKDKDTILLELEEAPVMFNYLVLAMQYGEDIFSEWKVLSVYTDDEDFTPKEVVVQKNRITKANLQVDWNNLPPQPF